MVNIKLSKAHREEVYPTVESFERAKYLVIFLGRKNFVYRTLSGLNGTHSIFKFMPVNSESFTASGELSKSEGIKPN